MTERRNNQRRQTAEYHLIYDRQNGDLIGRVTSMTADGCRVISPDPIEVGKRFQCRMRLPDLINGVWEIQFDMQSRWSEYRKAVDWHESGFAFVDLTELARGAVEVMTRQWPAEKSQNNPFQSP